MQSGESQAAFLFVVNFPIIIALVVIDDSQIYGFYGFHRFHGFHQNTDQLLQNLFLVFDYYS